MKKNQLSGKKSEDVTLTEIESDWPVPQKDLVKPKNVPVNIDYSKLKAIADNTLNKINIVEGILEVLPDLELVGEVLIASILSPKDLSAVTLQIGLDKRAPSGASDLIKETMNEVFDLDSKLPTILKESLYTIGSYSLLTLPTKVVSDMINSNSISLESLTETDVDSYFPPTGFLKTNTTYAMESIHLYDNSDKGKKIDNGKIELTDHVGYLAIHAVDSIVTANKNRTALADAYGLEGSESPTVKSLYLNRKAIHKETVKLKNDTAESSITHSIILNIPAEAVIPVSIPGEPDRHTGYYVLNSKDGNFFTGRKMTDTFKDLKRRLEKNSLAEHSAGMITTNLKMDGGDDTSLFSQGLIDAYGKSLEEELLDALNSGTVNKGSTVTIPEEIYRVMYARQLAGQGTRLVYVPAEMLTYVAFNYDDLGIGISLVEKTKLYASLRAALMFAELMAGIKNSVPNRVLNITLDENDLDPQGTVETVTTEYVALQSDLVPLTKIYPADIVDSLQRAGVQVKVEGGSLFPATGIDVEERQRDIKLPDSTLTDRLKHAHYAGLHVSPESVDQSLQADYATTVVASNLLQAKRVMLLQNTFTGKISEFIRKFCYAGGPLFNELKEMVDDSKEKDFDVYDLIKSITAGLPKADLAAITAQKQAFEEYSDFIEMAVEQFVSEDMIADSLEGDTVGTSIETVRLAIINLMRRKYLRKQNMLPELDLLLTDADDDTITMIKDHNKELMAVVGDIHRSIMRGDFKEDKKSNKLRDKLEGEGDEEENSDGDVGGEGDGLDTNIDGGDLDEGMEPEDATEGDEVVEPEVDDAGEGEPPEEI